MRNPKILALPIVLMFGLLSTGMAYACWQDTLHIYGDVDTGCLEWQWVGVTALDLVGPDYHCRDRFAGPPPFFWVDPEEKDVGSTTASVDPNNTHVINVTLTNVYPCYFNEMSMYAMNTGTIPLIIDRVTINGNVLRAADFPYPVIQLDLNGDGSADIEILWGDSLGTQLEPGWMSPEMSFWIHVLQPCPQNAELHFTIELVAVQWNMYGVPEP